MHWLRVEFQTTRPYIDELCDLLERSGAAAVTLSDAGQNTLYEPAPGDTPVWPKARVSALFEERTDLEALLQDVARALGASTAPLLAADRLEDRDWVRAWMADFRPMRFGTRLWICPSWHRPPDAGAVNILLDPGLAFGTGTHATTAMCLESLDAVPPRGLDVVDYGCGSGILSLAAAALGAAHVMAVDHDPQAIEATTQNALRNRLSARITAALPSAMAQGSADLVVSNILARPLVELAPTFAGLAREGAAVLLSGILQEQATAVIEAYQPWFEPQGIVERDGWVCIRGLRRATSAAEARSSYPRAGG